MSDSADSVLIETRDLGVRFRRHRASRDSLKAMLAGLITNAPPPPTEQYLWAVRHLDLQVRCGDRLGVIGNNGAGKTTLLQVLSGIYAPQEGEVLLHGQTGALLSLTAGLNPQLTGVDNIFLFGLLQGLTRPQVQERIGEIVTFSELGEFIYEPVRTYSAGMRARLGFSIVSSIEPELLLLDEVLGVGDVHFRKKCRQRLEQMIERVRAIVVVTHDLGFVRTYCNRAMWLDSGRVRKVGDSESVLAAYETESSAGLGRH